MKKVMLLSFLLCLLSLKSIAFNPDCPGVQFVTFSYIVYGNGGGVLNPTNGEPNVPRGPVYTPEAYLEGYTLSLDHSCLGCTLRLVDENDNVVYTTIINGDTLVLPSTLSGEYELQILFDDCYFYGYIEL